MASTFIRDERTGAAEVKFADLSDEELRDRALVFPEALAEYTKRLLGQTVQNTPK